MTTWIEAQQGLIAAVRISFKDKNKNILLDSTMYWHDFFFLIEALMVIAKSQFECGRKYVEMDNLNILINAKKIRARITNIQNELNRIKELMPIYKIELPSEPAKGKEEEKK